MKKWQVLAAVLLLALAGGLRLLRERPSNEPGLPPVQVLLSGQALPEDTTRYYIPEEFLAVPPRTGRPAGHGPLPVIKNEAYDRGLCKGGSLNEILSSHGRVWGYGARHGSFREKESLEIYGLLAQYLACVGLARRAPEFCDYLPGENDAAGVGFYESPNYDCRDRYMNVSFAGFAAGREKSEEACAILLTSRNLAEGPRVRSAEFCAAAAKGMEAVCPALAASLGAKRAAECRRALPAGDSDCGSDGECRARLAAYRAMKAGDGAACQEKDRELCGAFLSGSEASCSVLLVRLGKAYCDYLASAQKRAKGYAGLTTEEAAEAIRAEAAEKVLEEARRVEIKRITDEVNSRARKMMGRPEEPESKDASR
jgi:hypothetical protein